MSFGGGSSGGGTQLIKQDPYDPAKPALNQIISEAGALYNQGVGPGQGYYGLIKHTLRQFTSELSEAEQKLVWQALHTATDGSLMSNASKMAVGQKTAGMLARGANEMFHISGLNGATNAMRNGYAYMSSNIMANNLKKNWDDLLPMYKKDFLEKHDITKQDWESWKEEIVFDFIEDNYFSELKESEMVRERFEMLASLDEYVGKYVSNEWIRKQILRQSEDEIEEIDKQIDKENEEDGEDLDLDI